MADAAPVVPVAPTNGAHPTTPQKPAVVKEPVAAAPVDDSEEYESVVDGKTVKTRLTKAQRAIEFQKIQASNKRFKEAADEKAKAQEILRLLDADPEEAMRRLGKNPDEVFAKHLEKKAKDALLTEEQRRVQAIEKERDDAKAEVAKTRKAQQDAHQATTDARTFKQYEDGLIAAQSKFGLLDEPDCLYDLASIGIKYLEDYDIALTADEIAEIYVEQQRSHLEQKDKKLHSVLKGEKLLKYLGDATLAEIDAARKGRDAESLKTLAPPGKVKVAAHERSVRPKDGFINENAFDKKFKL